MKLRSLGWALAALTLALTAAGAGADTGQSGFVTRAGTRLLLDGKPFVFAGINIYNANSDGSCWYPLDHGTGLDRSLGALHGRNIVIRAWFFQNLATTDGARDWRAFDHTLALARRHGVRVIATLGNQWSACDKAAGYKDVTWYTRRYKQREPDAPESYRAWVAEVARRYRANPTVLAWQLLNEAQVTKEDGSCVPGAASILKRWATDVSRAVKAADPNHLISLGTVGSGPCGTDGPDYVTVHSIPTIDLCEYHDFDQWSPISGDGPNGLATRYQQCKALNKPLFVGEVGIEVHKLGGPEDRAMSFDAKLRATLAAGIVGDLVWDWNLKGSLNGFEVGPGDPTLAVISRYAPPPPGFSGRCIHYCG